MSEIVMNGVTVDVTEYNGNPQDQLVDETDEAYLWFLKYLANMNWSVTDVTRECEEMKSDMERRGVKGHVPSRVTVFAWSSKHDWQKRKIIYNKIHLDPIKDKIQDERHAQFETFFQNELDLALVEQVRVIGELGALSKIKDAEKRVSIRFRTWKALEIIRTVIKEDLGTHVLLERLKQAGHDE